MPEILGSAPLYFDPYDIDDIAKKMAKVVSDKNLQADLKKRGLKQVKKYRWRVTAKKTLEIYRKNLGLIPTDDPAPKLP